MSLNLRHAEAWAGDAAASRPTSPAASALRGARETSRAARLASNLFRVTKRGHAAAWPLRPLPERGGHVALKAKEPIPDKAWAGVALRITTTTGTAPLPHAQPSGTMVLTPTKGRPPRGVLDMPLTASAIDEE